MVFFCYMVYELLVGPAAARTLEADSVIEGLIEIALVMTVISWRTYSVEYTSLR